MQYTKAHGEETQSKIWFHVTNASTTTAIAAGGPCAWDTTDNTAVAGIMRETRGCRVIPAPAGIVTASTESQVCGVAEVSIPATAAGQTRDDAFLMQKSGFHPAVVVSGNTSVWRLLTINDSGALVQAAAADPTIPELMGSVGVCLRTATAPGTIQAILRFQL